MRRSVGGALAVRPSGWPAWAQYVLAFGVMAAAIGIRWAVEPLVGPGDVPFVSVFGALLVLVLVVQPGPFLLATSVGGLGALYLFVEPRFSLRPTGVGAVWEMALFGASGAAAVTAAWLSRQVQARRAEAERELARRGEEIRLVTDAVPALIAYVDAELRYRFVNARYADWFGRSTDEIIGRRLADVLGDEAYSQARPHAEAALRGERRRYATDLPHPRGGTRHVVADYVPHVLEEGSVVGLFALVSDVTEQKEAEAAQARLASIVETSGDAITSISLDGRFMTWNAGAERLFGYSAQEAIGRDVDLIFPPDRAGYEREIVDRVRDGVVVGPYDTVRRTRDGRDVDVSVTASPIRDAQGTVVGASKVDRDISDRLATERALRASQKELQTARARERSYLDHLPVGVWFADPSGALVYANEAARTIWGGVRMVGPEGYGEFEAYWHGTERRLSGNEWALHRALRDGEASLDEVVDIVAFDGARRTLLNSAVPVRDEAGEIVGGVVMNMDITDLKRAESALREADRRKDEFLATLSHELRNPLSAIQAATEFLARRGESAGDGRFDRAAATVQRQVAMMIRLVDDLLDVSRITRGALTLHRERVSLDRVVREALDATEASIARRDHTVEAVLPEEPVEVEGDAVRLVQVVTNLLSNASEYTEPGGRIEVGLRREAGEAVVGVRDDGPGIPVEELESVFEMFTRLESDRPRPSGLGIGLSLSRRLVELHGGTLTAHSEGPGRGTLMTVRLPAAPPGPLLREEAPGTEPDTERSPHRVLIVDDNADSADMLAALLEEGGHEVRTAYDGREGLREAASYEPDVVLLDLGLPDLDGLEVCRRLRREPWGRRAIVVALSGWGHEEDRRKTADAGFDAHLTKPSSVEEVLHVLDRQSRERTDRTS